MSTIEHMAQKMRNRIEQLTAERDAAYARGYSDAETEISKSALGQRNYFLHSQYENATDHIKVLTAERDRLRGALLDHNDLLRSAIAIAEREGVRGEIASTNWDAYYNQAAVVLKRHHQITTDARAALKGESHD